MGEGEGQGVVGGERDGAGLYMWGLELLFRGGKRIAREIFAHRERETVGLGRGFGVRLATFSFRY